VVYANEVIAQARLFAEGFDLDESSVALEEVIDVGPGGSFLTSDLTLKLFRRAAFQSEIFPNLTLEKWQEMGAPEAGRVLRQHTVSLLESLEPPEDHGDLMDRGEVFISGSVF
jgi:trimethylamine--corrinoid protein Co-methyltransferase